MGSSKTSIFHYSKALKLYNYIYYPYLDPNCNLIKQCLVIVQLCNNICFKKLGMRGIQPRIMQFGSISRKRKMMKKTKGKPSKTITEVRKNFPETWIWDSVNQTGLVKNGQKIK